LDALLTAFLAASLGEWGDKTQLLVVLLAARYRRPAPILAAIAVAATANSLIAAFAGTLIHGTITPRAASLLLALALVFAGVAGLIGSEPKDRPGWRLGPFLATLILFTLAEWGDKTQFVTAAIAARFDALVLPAAGAAAGILVSSLPAAALGPRLAQTVPLKAIRISVACLFLLAGLWVGVSALRLI
jgi:putative Ca2+/H+ antiporter (TMEM165/GDT1 family)